MSKNGCIKKGREPSETADAQIFAASTLPLTSSEDISHYLNAISVLMFARVTIQLGSPITLQDHKQILYQP